MYHLMYLKFDELEAPFEARHFKSGFLAGQLYRAHVPHRRRDVDEEHGNCVLILVKLAVSMDATETHASSFCGHYGRVSARENEVT
jgi:hypothetical protein